MSINKSEQKKPEQVPAVNGKIGLEWEFQTTLTGSKEERLIQYGVEYFRVYVGDEPLAQVYGETHGKLEFVTVPLAADQVLPAVGILKQLRQLWAGELVKAVKTKEKGLAQLLSFFKKKGPNMVTVGPSVKGGDVRVSGEADTVHVEEGDAILGDQPAGCQKLFRDKGVHAPIWCGMQANIDVPLRVFQKKNWAELFQVAAKFKFDMGEWVEVGEALAKSKEYQALADAVLQGIPKDAKDDEAGFAGLVALMRVQDEMFVAQKKDLDAKGKDVRGFLPKVNADMIEDDEWVAAVLERNPAAAKALFALECRSLSGKPLRSQRIDAVEGDKLGVRRVVCELRKGVGVLSELNDPPAPEKGHEVAFLKLFDLVTLLWDLGEL